VHLALPRHVRFERADGCIHSIIKPNPSPPKRRSCPRYALPTLQWERYWLTEECALIDAGPSTTPQPDYCFAKLTARAASGGFGMNATQAEAYCGLLTGCGWPCGADLRGAAACAAAVAAVGGGAFAPGAVPVKPRDALCPAGPAACDAYSTLLLVEQYWDARHEKQHEEDFKRVDSLLFNSFIFLQVLLPGGGWFWGGSAQPPPPPHGCAAAVCRTPRLARSPPASGPSCCQSGLPRTDKAPGPAAPSPPHYPRRTIPAAARPKVFNEINARRINDELNMFQGIHTSPIFIGVIAITVGLQVKGVRGRLLGLCIRAPASA
jgi:hypothetical protein